MSKKYIEITADQILGFLKTLSINVQRNYIIGCNEVVYCVPLKKNNNLLLRVYTGTSNITGITRSKSMDAIRVVLFHKTKNSIVKSSKRINRVDGWMTRLKERMVELGNSYTENSCPICQQPDAVLLERTNRTDATKFLGCINFPTCKHIQKI